MILNRFKSAKFVVNMELSTRREDVEKNNTPSRIRLKPDAKLHTQRPNKVPVNYRQERMPHQIICGNIEY